MNTLAILKLTIVLRFVYKMPEALSQNWEKEYTSWYLALG